MEGSNPIRMILIQLQHLSMNLRLRRPYPDAGRIVEEQQSISTG
jgi:hypothetical protein